MMARKSEFSCTGTGGREQMKILLGEGTFPIGRPRNLMQPARVLVASLDDQTSWMSGKNASSSAHIPDR